MPLPIASSDDLHIPEAMYNGDGLAVLIMQGGRYGGDWVIQPVNPDGPDQPAGEFRTSVDDRSRQHLQGDPGYPDRAIETAFIWLIGETIRQGLRVVMFECLNSEIGEAERPYFCAARAVIASQSFEPAPGVTYADEQTLDAAA